MALYLAGDLQGCYDELCRLLDQVRFDPAVDQLWLTGDLVARGSDSLSCLRLVHKLSQQGAARTVVGNHDLHLLSIDAGVKRAKPGDRLSALLQAPDRPELIDWLRRQPLLIHDAGRRLILCHAGLAPGWSLATALGEAAATEAVLQSSDYVTLLEQMYGNQPDQWHEHHTGWDRHRFTINALTRMRLCFADGRLEFACKLPPEQAPPELQPWFTLPPGDWQGSQLVFGHWAALMGQAEHPHPAATVHALDTGCVWGEHLTLLRWEDKQLFTQPATQH